jgi:hypothetical protein
MNYQNVYNSLIKKAQVRKKPDCYTERHHILPKSLGGSNAIENLVDLTAREHCLAHLLLAKIYGGGMWHAANVMTNAHTITSKAYAIVRQKHAEEMSIKITGKNNPMFGKTGDKNPFFGKSHFDQTKKAIGIKNSGENNAWFGKKRPDHGASILGSKSPVFKGFITATRIADGFQIILAGTKALEAEGFDPSNVTKCIKGKQVSHKGHTFTRIKA